MAILRRNPFPSNKIMAAKKPDNRTHAQRRRAETREALRAKFQGVQYIAQLDAIYTAMDGLEREVAEEIVDELQPTVLRAETQLKILKAKADLNFRRLAKILPDLKQTELVDADGGSAFGALADALKAAVHGG